MQDSAPLAWRNISERYNLLGSKCTSCSTSYFPPRSMCTNCRRKGKLVPSEMPRTGKIYSFTQVFSAPAGFENEAPYFMALIELENGVRVLSQLVDTPSEKVKLDAPVRMVFRRIYEGGHEGAIAYGFKFKVE